MKLLFDQNLSPGLARRVEDIFGESSHVMYHELDLAHFHTGGVSGRNELDETQELNYRRIAEAVVGTGFKGCCAHEFLPKRRHRLPAPGDPALRRVG